MESRIPSAQSGLRRIALTGNIASGKSAVSDVWRSLGAVVIDADELARAAVLPGTRALRDIVRRFGPGVLDADGRLDRAALRRIVFADEQSRAELEKIMHPEIERLRLEAERAAAAQGTRTVVHAIPLLFETGLDGRFETIVLVDAPVETRRRRLMEKRGLGPDEADAMINAQMDPALKRERARFVIDNAGTLEDLRRQAFEVWALLEAEA